MKGFGYIQSNGDHTFIKHGDQSKVTALIVYVDDIIITGDDTEEIKCLGQNLAREFHTKSLGRLKYFLEIEYILDLLQEIEKLQCKPAGTPIDPNLSLGEGKGSDQVGKSSYQWLIGRLIYLNHTRPDITFVVNLLRNQSIEIYTDVDYVGSIIDRRLTSGYRTSICGNLVPWRSKKQQVAARSSAEAEFRTLAQEICAGLWIQGLLDVI
ncbi:unnamed protein product [Spirodela intermedia]|uniref:Reverse transcriptase Ty1/copia-type domain-containing protein n=1 Tax=Spirodela intermedia TaxID=51605 RepID=A0A7I8L450_SPIIN|nr:unnamed protein product [Spirodela intermedia]